LAENVWWYVGVLVGLFVFFLLLLGYSMIWVAGKSDELSGKD
jgi:hypothetical protein